MPPSVGARSRPVSAMEGHNLQHTLSNSTEEEGVESEVRRIMLAEGIENEPNEASRHSLGGIEDSVSIPVRQEVTSGIAAFDPSEQKEQHHSGGGGGGGGGEGGRKGSVDESSKPFVRTRDSVDTQVRLGRQCKPPNPHPCLNPYPWKGNKSPQTLIHGRV